MLIQTRDIALRCYPFASPDDEGRKLSARGYVEIITDKTYPEYGTLLFNIDLNKLSQEEWRQFKNAVNELISRWTAL